MYKCWKFWRQVAVITILHPYVDFLFYLMIKSACALISFSFFHLNIFFSLSHSFFNELFHLVISFFLYFSKDWKYLRTQLSISSEINIILFSVAFLVPFFANNFIPQNNYYNRCFHKYFSRHQNVHMSIYLID